MLTGALATVAHVGADGRTPDLGVVVLLVALLSWVAYAFAGRERGPVTILAMVGGGQLAMHAALTYLAWESHAGHSGAQANTAQMTGAHAVATLVVVALLAGAERVLFALTKLIASVLPRKLAPQPAASPLRICAFLTMEYPATEALLRDVLSRRGPPVASA